MKNIKEGDDDSEAKLSEPETPEQRREKIVLHLLETRLKKNWTNSTEENRVKVVAAMINLARETEMSAERQGGRNAAIDLQVFRDLGAETNDPYAPYHIAISEIVGAGLSGKPYAPIHVKKFIKTYMILYSTGLTTVSELVNRRHALHHNTGDVSTGQRNRGIKKPKII